MPADLIVPAFALTLAANAILIALAIRTFASERARDRRAIAPGETRAPEPAKTATAASTQSVPTNRAPVAEASAPPAARKRSSPAKTAAATTASATPAAKPTARPRRRFALPQHEETGSGSIARSRPSCPAVGAPTPTVASGGRRTDARQLRLGGGASSVPRATTIASRTRGPHEPRSR